MSIRDAVSLKPDEVSIKWQILGYQIPFQHECWRWSQPLRSHRWLRICSKRSFRACGKQSGNSSASTWQWAHVPAWSRASRLHIQHRQECKKLPAGTLDEASPEEGKNSLSHPFHSSFMKGEIRLSEFVIASFFFFFAQDWQQGKFSVRSFHIIKHEIVNQTIMFNSLYHDYHNNNISLIATKKKSMIFYYYLKYPNR